MSEKKVILCYPLLNRYKRERRYHWFPFSLLGIAQALASHGCEPVVIDFRVEKNPYRKLRKHLKDPLFVGISSMSGYQIAGGLRIAEAVKKINPRIPIVWGGWHPTILPEETAEHALVDIAVAGNGVKPVLQIADALEYGNNLDKIKAIAYKKNKTVKFTGYDVHQSMEDNVQKYSRFIDIQRYINPETRAVGYFSGHGCGFMCGFCSRHFMTKKYHPYSVDKVIDDIMYYVSEHKLNKIHFQDDNFFINPKRVIEISERLLLSKLDVKWWANIRSNIIYKFSKEEIELLVRSGLTTLFIGVESASQGMLDIMKKGTKAEDIIKTNKIMRSHGVDLHLSYMFGVPYDSIEDLRMTIKQIKVLKRENKNIRVQTCFYQPFPGTELYKRSLELGYPVIKGLESWSALKPQQRFNKIPWLSKREMVLYKQEFNSFFVSLL